MDPVIRDRQFFALVAASVNEARVHVRKLETKGGWIPSVSRYPNLKTFESGWPNITYSTLSSGNRDYSGLFGLERSQLAPIGFDDVVGLRAVAEYAAADLALREALRFTEHAPEPSIDDRLFRVQVGLLVFKILDRAIHLHGLDFNDDDLAAVYSDHEAWLLEEKLPIEIVVPVAMTPFETESAVSAGASARVERMSDEFQLARMPDSQYGPGAAANPVVVGAATHAVVFSGYTMPNKDRYRMRWDLLSFYPLEQIGCFFTALRLETGLPTGFAQICIRPLGWASSWVASLPPVISGATGRQYPAWFDDWGWLRKPPPPISDMAVARTAKLYKQLEGAPAHLVLAARRLSAAMLRDREDDSIVDLCIGLEAALGDRQRTEMTHKIALRTAAVLAASPAPSRSSSADDRCGQ